MSGAFRNSRGNWEPMPSAVLEASREGSPLDGDPATVVCDANRATAGHRFHPDTIRAILERHDAYTAELRARMAEAKDFRRTLSEAMR